MAENKQKHGIRLSHAVILFLIYWTIPYFWYDIPLKLLLSGVVLAYCSSWRKIINPREIGLRLGERRRSRVVLYGMLLFVFIFTPGVLAILYQFEERTIETGAKSTEYTETPYARFEDMRLPECMPRDNIYDNLYQKDITGVLESSIKPIIVTMITSPVFETIFVIGILFSALGTRWGTIWGLVIIGIFGIVLHLPGGLTIPSIGIYFVIHVTMAALFLYTKSIYPSILLHFWYNALVYTLPILINWGLPPPID